jgi:hypothetical protein
LAAVRLWHLGSVAFANRLLLAAWIATLFGGGVLLALRFAGSGAVAWLTGGAAVASIITLLLMSILRRKAHLRGVYL